MRKNRPYAAYDKVDFDIPIGKNGDCYDRYLIRMEEMKQSLNIINQVLNKMPSGPIITDNPRIAPPKKERYERVYGKFDKSFKFIQKELEFLKGHYTSVEAPKGEFGVYLVSDGSNKPYRCKIRAPGFPHLQGLDFMTKGINLQTWLLV